MGARWAPLTLLAGMAVAVGTVAVYQWWWGLLLAAAATLAAVLATPAGWATRLPYALGFCAVAVVAAVPRGEGDYLVGATTSGYAVLVLALVVLMLSIATLPRPGRTGGRQTEGKAAQE